MRDVLRYLADCRYIWMGALSGIAYAAVFGLYGIRWGGDLVSAAAGGGFRPVFPDSRIPSLQKRITVGLSVWIRRMGRARIICPGRQPDGTGLSGTGAKKRREQTVYRRKNGTPPAGT